MDWLILTRTCVPGLTPVRGSLHEAKSPTGRIATLSGIGRRGRREHWFTITEIEVLLGTPFASFDRYVLQLDTTHPRFPLHPMIVSNLDREKLVFVVPPALYKSDEPERLRSILEVVGMDGVKLVYCEDTSCSQAIADLHAQIVATGNIREIN